MEEQNVTNENTTITPPQPEVANPTGQPQTAVPGAVVAFVFGIISLATFYIGVWVVIPGLIPLIFGIIAWSKGKKCEKIYAENPAMYVKAHGVFSKLGKIFGLIGWILAILFMLIGVIVVLVAGSQLF